MTQPNHEMKLQPYDVLVVDGLWYMPHHWLIRWRGLDKGVHCCLTVSRGGHTLLSPEFTGLKIRHLEEYKGRRVTVHRYCGDAVIDQNAWASWLHDVVVGARGYDFRQWFMGFLLGFTSRGAVDASAHWTCAELPYWLFQENGNLTPYDEVLPMPRFFRFSPKFRVVFDGIL